MDGDLKEHDQNTSTKDTDEQNKRPSGALASFGGML